MVLFIFLIIIRMFAFNSHKKTQWQLLQFDIDDFEKSNDIDKQPVIIFGSEKLIKYLIKEMREHNFHILNATYYNGSKSVVAFHHNEKIANEKIKDIARYILKHGLSAAKRQVKNKLELTPPSEDLQLQRYQKTTQMIRENSHSRRL